MTRYVPLLFVLSIGCSRKEKALVVVSDEDSGDVAVIDPVADTVVRTIAVGKRGMRVSPDGKTLYVAVTGSQKGGPGVEVKGPRDDAADGIAVVDLERGVKTRTLPSGQDPEAFDITPDGKRIFVSNEETAEVSEVDILARPLSIPESREGVLARRKKDVERILDSYGVPRRDK